MMIYEHVKTPSGAHFTAKRLAYMQPQELEDSIEQFFNCDDHIPQDMFAKSALTQALALSHKPTQH